MNTSRTDLVAGLRGVLADTFVLYFRTHSFHWNVRGAHFHMLHGLFGEQYESLHDAVDVLAERLRAIDEAAPSSLASLLATASLREVEARGSREMIASLAEGHGALATTLRRQIDVAEEAGDPVTADLYTQRASEHEKAAWMLRAHLDE